MPGRRYNCRCGKKRYRDEAAALAAAATDQQAYGGTVTVYRCPGGLAWHLTSRGFTAPALRSVGRRLAVELIEHGEVDLDDFRARTLRPGAPPDSRRARAVQRRAGQLAELGLARWDSAAAATRLRAVNLDGLRRVTQIGLDAYAQERAG